MVAFALGGLGGFNAHGLGFLQAAREAGVRPSMVSCTSGMIHWFWRYLEGADLRAELAQTIADRGPIRSLIPQGGSEVVASLLNWHHIATHGLAGIFRPAYHEHIGRLTRSGMRAWKKLLRHPGRAFDLTMPAKIWSAEFPEEHLEAIAASFNAASFPILFNSFDPQHGVEFLHMNDAAFEMRERSVVFSSVRDHPRKRRALPEVICEPITPHAVGDALWLKEYGFKSEHGKQARIDGAYVRQFILTELCEADLIYVARPQRYNWKGHLPRNVFEMKDFEIELWLNGSYAQQIHHIDFINRLVKKGMETRAGRLTATRVIPVEPKERRGFFGYFVEDLRMFDAAVELGHKHLGKAGLSAALHDSADELPVDLAVEVPAALA